MNRNSTEVTFLIMKPFTLYYTFTWSFFITADEVAPVDEVADFESSDDDDEIESTSDSSNSGSNSDSDADKSQEKPQQAKSKRPRS